MSKSSRGRRTPHEDHNDILIVAAGIINTLTLEEEDDTKRSFVRPALIRDNTDPFYQQLRRKDSKSEETQQRLEGSDSKREVESLPEK